MFIFIYITLLLHTNTVGALIFNINVFIYINSNTEDYKVLFIAGTIDILRLVQLDL